MNSRPYFKNLDAIRFIAALLVFIQHSGTGIDLGNIGVSIFFTLSGFLITYLILWEIETTGKFNIGSFYLRRVLRIWPLYFAVVLFAFVIYPYLKSAIGIHTDLCSNAMYQWFFISNFDVIHIEKYCPGHDEMMQNITWSVSIEEQFYLVWPLIFLLFPRNKFSMVMFIMLASSFMFRLWWHSDIIVVYFHTFTNLIYLAIGGLYACLLHTQQRFRNYFQRPGAIHLILLAIFIPVIIYQQMHISGYGLSIQGLTFAIMFGYIISLMAMLSKVNIPFISVFGKYTYGMYLLHPIALLVIDILFRYAHIDHARGLSFASYFTISLAVTIAVSMISYYYFETPFMKMQKKTSGR